MVWHYRLSSFARLDSISNIDGEWEQQSHVHGAMATQAIACKRLGINYMEDGEC